MCSVTRHDRRVADVASDDLLALLEDALQDVDEQELDRELAELVEQLAAEPPELRARRRRRRSYRPRPLIDLRCTVCGQAFSASRRDARYCSTPCRVAAWRERHAAR